MSGYLIGLIAGGGVVLALAMVIAVGILQRRPRSRTTGNPELDRAADDLQSQIDRGRSF